MQIKVYHSSDWHWNKDAKKRAKLRNSYEAILYSMQELRPNFHIITGDYFDNRQSFDDRSIVPDATDALIEMANICPIIMIKGNDEHDAPGSIEELGKLKANHPIVVSTRSDTIVWRGEDDFRFVTSDPTQEQLEGYSIIHTLSYPYKSWFLSKNEALSIDDANNKVNHLLSKMFATMGHLSKLARENCISGVPPFCIFAGHGEIVGATIATGQEIVGQSLKLNSSAVKAAACDYYAWGHIHYPHDVNGMVYAGSMSNKDWGEVDQKSFNIVNYVDGKTSYKRIYLPSSPMVKIKMEWNAEKGTLDIPATLPDLKGSEVMVKVSVPEEAASLVDDIVKRVLGDVGELTIKKNILPTERTRSIEITETTRLSDKLRVWGKATGKEITSDMIELADEIERSL